MGEAFVGETFVGCPSAPCEDETGVRSILAARKLMDLHTLW